MERILGRARRPDLNKTADFRPRENAMRVEGDAATARGERSRIAGVGRVLTWNGGSLWIGHSAGHSAMHSHHAIQLSIALAGPFEMKSGRSGAWSRHSAALVRPDVRHEFNGCGTTIAQVF